MKGVWGRKEWIGILGVASVLAMSVPSFAADAGKIGVIDPQAVLEKSKSGKRALDTLKEYAAARQKLLSGDEEELRNAEKQLKDQEASMTEAQKKEKQEQFRTKIGQYQKRAQEFNQELSGKQRELVEDYMKKIQTVTRSVAEKGGYIVVVDKGSEATLKIVIYNKDSLDITDQVIKEFDRQYNK
jgi:outer membrane protein